MSNLEEYLSIVTIIQFIIIINNMKELKKVKQFVYNKVVTTDSLGTAVLEAVSTSMPTIIQNVQTAIAIDLDKIVDAVNENTDTLNGLGGVLGTEIMTTAVPDPVIVPDPVAVAV
jgi:hypothetical protein